MQRFERELKPQLQLEKFSYGGAEALGDQGFVLKDVVAVAPATPETDNKPTTVRIDMVTVEVIDFERFAAERTESLPRFLKMKFEGVTGEEATTKRVAHHRRQGPHCQTSRRERDKPGQQARRPRGARPAHPLDFRSDRRMRSR